MVRAVGTSVLVINLLFCLLTVWQSGSNPEDFASKIGFSILNAGGLNEVRAQYAGFFLATALVCLASLLGWIPRQTSFLLLGTIFGGLLAGRLASLALNGGVSGYGPTILALYVVDAVGLALAMTAFLLERPASA
jgi:uncharacterized membrane-anchored protein YitT (DUF2179 family)